MFTNRFSRLQALMETHNLDAVAINPGPTLTYLTGLNFHLMERPTVLLVARGKEPALVLPELETGKLAGLSVKLNAFPFGDNPATWGGVYAQAGMELDLSEARIGVEPNRFRFLELTMLQEALPQAKFVSGEALFSALRMQKDTNEAACMKRAVQIAQEAFEKTLPFVRVGVTEKEIAAELSAQLLRAGSSPEMPFQPIIASGPNSANPHAVPSDRKITPGDLVVIDWGAASGGYISDLTRTLGVAPVDPELIQIAEIVRLANKAGCGAARPGITAGEVDRATREVIADSGYGSYFIHRTGHGIGMEGHEPPYIFGENELVLQPGMAFTVEPGIYLPGRGGVRIEDNVVITENGAEILSDLPRTLFYLL